MALSNRDYLYDHLPARFRREDRELSLFLKRFLHWFGEQLDGWDAIYDTFYSRINPQTAPDEFVVFWLWALFGWSWYPSWFTLTRKQRLYANFATHLARRGTSFGIEDFLRDFSIFARVYARPQYIEEAYLGDEAWGVEGPLGVVVQISHLADEVNHDVYGQGIEEAYLEESFASDTRETLSKREIEDLIRFQWPQSQRVMIDYRVRPAA